MICQLGKAFGRRFINLYGPLSHTALTGKLSRTCHIRDAADWPDPVRWNYLCITQKAMWLVTDHMVGALLKWIL